MTGADPAGSHYRGLSGGAALRHDSLAYGADDEYLAEVAPFVRDGLKAGEPVIVITTPRNSALLREALGDADRVEFADNTEFYRRPPGALARLAEARQEHERSGQVRGRVVGEATFGPAAAEQLEWLRYEAVVNEVFASASQWLLCTYDQRELPEWVVDEAARTHSHLRSDGRRVRNGRFGDPAELARELAPPPPDVPGAPVWERWVDRNGVATARQRLARLAADATGGSERADEVTIGLVEVVTNAVTHGSDRALVRCWLDQQWLVCDVLDDGPGLDDPFAGFRPPAAGDLYGRGLWIARQVLDALELQPGPEGGLHVRAGVRRARRAGGYSARG